MVGASIFKSFFFFLIIYHVSKMCWRLPHARLTLAMLLHQIHSIKKTNWKIKQDTQYDTIDIMNLQ
jgi:hypothetical protein